MPACRFGGSDGRVLEFEDRDDLVVVRSTRRGVVPEPGPAARGLRGLFAFPPAGVGVFEAPAGGAARAAAQIDAEPDVQFAGRGLRDASGTPVVYTENVFVKFADDVPVAACREAIAAAGLTLKRTLGFATNAFFAAAPARTGTRVFDVAAALLGRDDVDLCHPELVREVGRRAANPNQWHLQPATIGGRRIDQDANVVAAWDATRGDGIVVAIIDDGTDIDHEEFASAGKLVAPRSLTSPHGPDPRPTDPLDSHGTATAGVAVADGAHRASGVAPGARLMPLRLVSGLGSVEEGQAFEWAADHGADVISCSWGPVDGAWDDPGDPQHHRVDPLPDSTRLAIDYAVRQGRDGRGCVVVWAAGNGNESVDNDGYASHPGVIAVAACNDRGTRSAYSDMGRAVWCAFPSNDVVDALTPGIWTTDRTGSAGYNPGDPQFGDTTGNYTNDFGGTSSAAPGVAGVVALILAVAPQLGPDDVRDVLRRSCDRIDPAGGRYDGDGHSPLYGFGRVNAARAVELAAQR